MMIPMARLVTGSLFLGDHMEIDQGRVDCGGDGVNLCGVAGTEYSQDAKSCEQICQPEKTPAQTIFNIVHGAAYQISIGIFFTDNKPLRLPQKIWYTYPKQQKHHIQNTEPGPPMAIAPATPAMLPVPTVAASAVHTAWNGVMAPSEAFLL